MPKKNSGTIVRFGQASVETFGDTYRLRFWYKGERKQFIVGKVSPTAYKVACDKALQIDWDLLYDQCDETLVKYRSTD